MADKENVITLKAGQWLWLDQADLLLELITATAELYIVLPEGRRIYINELAAGQSMVELPVSADKIRLLALVTTAGEAVFRSWKETGIAPATVDSILQILLNWPDKYLNPRVYQPVQAGQTLELEAGQYIKTADVDAILWIEVAVGRLQLCGAREGTVFAGDIVAISRNIWLKSTERTQCKAYSTETLAKIKAEQVVLDLFTLEQQWFLAVIADNMIDYRLADSEKMLNDKLQNDIVMNYAIHELLRNDIKSLPPVIKRNEQHLPPIFIVARIIAQNMGLSEYQFKSFNSSLFKVTQNELVQAAAASVGMIPRKVKLTGDWYLHDHGELLIFMDGNSYAATPVNSQQYQFVDPVNGIVKWIDQPLAEQIEETAYMFYPQLPAEITSVGEWLRWSLKFCWKRDLWILLFACIIAGIIPIITPFITQTVFEDIIPSYDKKAHLIVIQVMFVTAAVSGMVNLVRGVAILRIKNKMHVVSEASLWLRLLALPASFFREYHIGDLAQRMQGVGQIYSNMSTVVASGIFNGIFSFWNVFVMCYYSWKLTLVALLFWAVYAIGAIFFSVRLVKFQRNKTAALGKVAGQTVQLFNSISKFRVQAAETRAFSLWAEKFSEEWKWNRKSRWQQNYLDFLNTVMNMLLTMLIFWMTIHWLDLGIEEKVTFLSQPDFLGFNAALGGFGSSLMGLLSAVGTSLAIIPLGERVRPILETTAESGSDQLEAGEFNGSIVVDNVSFRYGEGKPLVLKEVSFCAQPGDFVAIVGASGCGKSTLLRLLLGLEKAENGIIEYDGIDLNKVTAVSVRRQIGVVLQHGQLMAGSILDNIIGSLPLTREDALEAAELAGLAEDIKEMPMGIDTVISEGANNISGGQRQRILIARAIVNRPRIIIFDEATSALDNRTQAIIAETLEKLNATRVVVAHRLSTIQKATKIMVMDEGAIVETGNFTELMQQEGLFAQLAKRQLV